MLAYLGVPGDVPDSSGRCTGSVLRENGGREKRADPGGAITRDARFRARAREREGERNGETGRETGERRKVRDEDRHARRVRSGR